MRLWNWFKDNPGLSVLLALIGVALAALGVARDYFDWKYATSTAGQSSPASRQPTVIPSPEQPSAPISESPEGSPILSPSKTTTGVPKLPGFPDDAGVGEDERLPASEAEPVPDYLIDRLETATNSAGAGSFSLSGKSYNRSVKKWCGPARFQRAQVWPSSGFSRFVATVGIADDERNAAGTSVEITLTDQDGRNLMAPFTVSLNRSKKVDIALNGTVQLQIDCLTQNDDSSVHATLGNAQFR